jgi:hypothetical protein
VEALYRTSSLMTSSDVDKRRTDKRRTADGGAFCKHMIAAATYYNTLN